MADPEGIAERNEALENSSLAKATGFDLIRQLLIPEPGFNEKKFEDHQRFTAILLAIVAFFLPSLWGWDYITDPVGAMNTINLRLIYLLLLALAVGFWSGQARYRPLSIAMPLSLLLGEGLYVEILNRLDTGMTHGMGGFMYAMFLSVLAGQGMPLSISLGFTVLATLLPHLMAIAGLSPEFPHLRYAILMWPAMGLTMATQCVLAHEYAQRYQLEIRLKALSNTDPLSAIANRRHFMELLDREIERSRRFGDRLFLLMLDIDHFKRINDTYGHAVGDQVIRHLAGTLRRGLRSIDGVGRIGGEEFALFLSGGEMANAREVAERLRLQIASSPTRCSPTLAVEHTVSIGLAELAPDDHASADLFIRADRALYAAKNGGRNKVMNA